MPHQASEVFDSFGLSRSACGLRRVLRHPPQRVRVEGVVVVHEEHVLALREPGRDVAGAARPAGVLDPLDPHVRPGRGEGGQSLERVVRASRRPRRSSRTRPAAASARRGSRSPGRSRRPAGTRRSRRRSVVACETLPSSGRPTAYSLARRTPRIRADRCDPAQPRAVSPGKAPSSASAGRRRVAMSTARSPDLAMSRPVVGAVGREDEPDRAARLDDGRAGARRSTRTTDGCRPGRGSGAGSARRRCCGRSPSRCAPHRPPDPRRPRGRSSGDGVATATTAQTRARGRAAPPATSSRPRRSQARTATPTHRGHRERGEHPEREEQHEVVGGGARAEQVGQRREQRQRHREPVGMEREQHHERRQQRELRAAEPGDRAGARHEVLGHGDEALAVHDRVLRDRQQDPLATTARAAGARTAGR